MVRGAQHIEMDNHIHADADNAIVRLPRNKIAFHGSGAALSYLDNWPLTLRPPASTDGGPMPHTGRRTGSEPLHSQDRQSPADIQ